MKAYVKTCDVCQRIKVFCYKLYNKLRSLLVAKKLWKKIIINFVKSLSSNKRHEVVYNLIFVIIDRYTRMTKYISIITRIDVAKLAKVFFDKIVLRFETLASIVSDKGFVFTSVF